MFRKNNKSDELDYKAINRFFYTSNKGIFKNKSYNLTK